MALSIVQHDIASLLDSWIEAERNGVQFPVPFDLAWGVAGYSMKHHGKRKLTAPNSQLTEGVDYITNSGESSPDGRSSDSIQLTCDGFKQFCLLAKTKEGKQIRQYFIESEKKWKLVKQIAPEFAGQIEVIAAQQELEKQKQLTFQSEQNLLSFRHYVTTALPKPTADRILGVTEIPEIEYRDRIVKDGIVINDGGTINKTEICKRFGILTKNGKPDYPRLNKSLSSMELPESAWVESEVIQTNRELKREYLEVLDRALYSAKERQLFLGE